MFKKVVGLLESCRNEVTGSLHFRSWEDWDLAHKRGKVDDKFIPGEGRAGSKSLFKTADLKIGKTKLNIFSPYYDNPLYDPGVARQLEAKEVDKIINPDFDWRHPELFSTEYLRKIHRIVEEELRRRDEEKVVPSSEIKT